MVENALHTRLKIWPGWGRGESPERVKKKSGRREAMVTTGLIPVNVRLKKKKCVKIHTLVVKAVDFAYECQCAFWMSG